MSKKHLVFIINPKSGVERQKEIKQGIEAHLDLNTYSYEILNTEYAKHGIILARNAAEQGAWAVVAVGGDGSLNDIAQGLLGSKTVLGIIPKGSGNGMARTLKIPLEVEGALKVINKGNIQNIDIGFANDRLFVSNAGVAFDALIAKKFAKSEKRGFWVYSWLVTKYMWLYKCWNWEITIDGKKFSRRSFMIIVANGQQFGYNFKIAPMAIFNDGLLDVIIIRRFPKILGGVIVLRAMNGTIAGSPYVEHFRTKELTLAHPSLKLMQTDGDAHECKSSINFSLKPGALQVIVP